MNKKNYELCLEDFEGKIYSINFILNTNTILIECIEIEPNSNEKYIIELSLKEWLNLDQFLSSLKSLSEIFNLLEKMKPNEFDLKKEKNQIFLKIKFPYKNQTHKIIIILKDIKTIKSDDLKSNNSIAENKILNNKNKTLEERIEFLEDYINRLKLSFPFNLFDDTLYELDNIFSYNLHSTDLISKKEYLGLINSGIKKIFKKNIYDCKLVYKFVPGENNNINTIRIKFQDLKNSLIIVKTMNNRTFGAFYKQENNNKIQGFIGNINIEKIFDSRDYKSNSFIFSLDNFKIYYSDLSYKDSYESPEFEITYDNNKAYYFGNEYQGDDREDINQLNQMACGFSPQTTTTIPTSYMAQNQIGNNQINYINNPYILSGNREFIISNLEVFEIRY